MFTAAEILVNEHECTGWLLEAETVEDLISQIGSFNEEKVYFTVHDTVKDKEYRLNENMELEEL